MKISMKDYNLDNFKGKDVYTWEEIISKIEELESELYTKKEELESLKQDLEDNYTRIAISKQVDISDKEFL